MCASQLNALFGGQSAARDPENCVVTEDVEARDALAGRLDAELGAFALTREDQPAYSVFRLDAPPGADYAFCVWVYDDGEPQLSAQLLEVQENHRFWWMPFEALDWRNPTARERAFFEALDAILNHPTRVIESRSLLLWSFSCDYHADGLWKPLREISIARWVRGVPRITGRRREYRSPRLVRAA